MNFDSLILNDNDRALSVYAVSFAFSLLTLTVFTILRYSLSEWIWKPFSWKSEWFKAKVKRENSDLCKTENVIKR